jgi:hypothetical protein
MSVIFDTSLGPPALRRRTPPASSPAVTLLRDLITDDRVILFGAIRQEILCRSYSILTTDKDFQSFQSYIPVHLSIVES